MRHSEAEAIYICGYRINTVTVTTHKQMKMEKISKENGT